MNIKSIFAVLGLILSFSFGSQAKADCVDTYILNSYRLVNSRTIDLRTNFNEVFRVQVNFCRSLVSARSISFERPYTCTFDNLLTLDWNNSVMERCMITDIKQIQ